MRKRVVYGEANYAALVPISFYYFGMLTKQDQFSLKLPNLNMRKIFVEYFNELHHIDVSTKYAI